MSYLCLMALMQSQGFDRYYLYILVSGTANCHEPICIMFLHLLLGWRRGWWSVQAGVSRVWEILRWQEKDVRTDETMQGKTCAELLNAVGPYMWPGSWAVWYVICSADEVEQPGVVLQFCSVFFSRVSNTPITDCFSWLGFRCCHFTAIIANIIASQ